MQVSDEVIDRWNADGEKRAGDVLVVRTPISDRLLRNRSAGQVASRLQRLCSVRSVAFFLRTDEDEKRGAQRVEISVGGFDKSLVSSMDDASSEVVTRLIAALS